MKIFAFSDWRTQSVADLQKIIQKLKPDLILYAGDDLERIVPFEKNLFLKTKNHFLKFNEKTFLSNNSFHSNEMDDGRHLKSLINQVTSRITQSDIQTKNIFGDIPFFFVNGNDDAYFKIDGEYYRQICGLSFWIRDNQESWPVKIYEKKNKLISIEPIFDVQSSENVVLGEGLFIKSKIQPSFGHFNFKGLRIFGYECEYGMETKVLNRPNKKADIFISHIPPMGILDLSTRFGMAHIGSQQVLKDLKEFKPRFIISGHSHLWGGQNKGFDKTHIINTSSHDNIGSSGNYVIIDTDKDSFHQKTLPFMNISQIRGGRAISYELKEQGDYETFDSLNRINLLNEREAFENILRQNKITLNVRVKERLDSLNWKQPKINNRISFNPHNCVYIDVETGLADGQEPGKLWLIGVLCDNVVTQFLFPKERGLFKKFITDRKNKPIVSWTGYDQKAICRSFKISNRWIDACQRVSNCVVWHNYQLARLHKDLFNTDETATMDGLFIGILADHRILNLKYCPYCPKKGDIVTSAIEKNRMDLFQMSKICQFLWDTPNKDI